MRVVQINIRATQGGAGRVCMDLHRRLRASGIDSHLLYGYGSGITDDPNVADDTSVTRTGNKLGVLGNYAAHWLVGRDLFTPGSREYRDEIDAADIIHVHAPHHYFMNWHYLAGLLESAGKPTVLTAHDWWYVTGRCGFIRDCTGWKRACGECGAQRFEDLPSLPDRSRSVRAKRMASLRGLAANTAFACPSQHLAQDYAGAMPWAHVELVPNGADLEFEEHVDSLPDGEREGVLFSASDLSAPGKIDGALLTELAQSGDVPILLVGRNNPFVLPNCSYLGEVRDRSRMVSLLKSVDSLMFCSRMDNAPLTILEALIAGCYVVAFDTPAAKEMIERVGGRCVSGSDEAEGLIRGGRVAELYGGVDRVELSRRARTHFSGERMLRGYLDLYTRLLDRAPVTASPQQVALA